MIEVREESFEGPRGLKIFTRAWRPAQRKAALVIVHGLNAHSGHYLWPGEQLAAAGFAVHALDLHGRGKSDGERFFVAKFSDYVDDVAAFVARVKAAEPGLPVFLLGHSAGGVVACLYTLDHPGELAGLICESFAHELPAPSFALAVIKGISHLAPHAHVLKLKNEDFSRDRARVEMMNNDPLIAHESQPTQTLAELVRADERLRNDLSKIALPVLILHGTADKATKPSGSQKFYDVASSTDKTLKLYEGHVHDLLADVGKEAVMAEIIAWLDARAGAASAR
jgi:alpha-beta hydrolase superfamily lysophospholipase